MADAVIRAITFDLWDTVFLDDSDEVKRADVKYLIEELKAVDNRSLGLEGIGVSGHMGEVFKFCHGIIFIQGKFLYFCSQSRP